MEIISTQKYILNSPKKVRVLVNMIRKLKPSDAVNKLLFVQKRPALIVRKVILTAIANAKQKNVNPDDLIFREILVNEGPRLKRWRAGARGRAKPYKRRMCHIRVVLTEIKVEKIKVGSDNAVNLNKEVIKGKNLKEKNEKLVKNRKIGERSKK